MIHKLGDERGFTLVEALIVFGILGLVLVGTLTLFVSGSRSSEKSTEAAMDQLPIVIAMERITKDLRQAVNDNVPASGDVNPVRLTLGDGGTVEYSIASSKLMRNSDEILDNAGNLLINRVEGGKAYRVELTNDADPGDHEYIKLVTTVLRREINVALPPKPEEPTPPGGGGSTGGGEWMKYAILAQSTLSGSKMTITKGSAYIGSGSLSNEINTVGDIHLDGFFTFANNTTITGKLYAKSGFTGKNAFVVGGDVYSEGPITANNADIGGFLRATTFIDSNQPKVKGVAYVTGDVGSTSSASFGSWLYSGGNVKFPNGAAVLGNVHAVGTVETNNGTYGGYVRCSGFTGGNAPKITGALYSTGNVYIQNSVASNIGGNLYCGGTITTQNGFRVVGDIYSDQNHLNQINGLVYDKKNGYSAGSFPAAPTEPTKPALPSPTLPDQTWFTNNGYTLAKTQDEALTALKAGQKVYATCDLFVQGISSMPSLVAPNNKLILENVTSTGSVVAKVIELKNDITLRSSL